MRYRVINTAGITSNDGIPETRRIQSVPVCTMDENQQNLETVFQLFDIRRAQLGVM